MHRGGLLAQDAVMDVREHCEGYKDEDVSKQCWKEEQDEISTRIGGFQGVKIMFNDMRGYLKGLFCVGMRRTAQETRA